MISQLSPATVSSQTRPTASTSPWKAVAELVGVEWHPRHEPPRPRRRSWDGSLWVLAVHPVEGARQFAAHPVEGARQLAAHPVEAFCSACEPAPSCGTRVGKLDCTRANLPQRTHTAFRFPRHPGGDLFTALSRRTPRSRAAYPSSGPGSRMSRPRTRRARSSRGASVYAHACSRPPHAQSIGFSAQHRLQGLCLRWGSSRWGARCAVARSPSGPENSS